MRRLSLTAVLFITSCGAEEPSLCHAPAAYTYEGAVRRVFDFAETAIDAMVLPDGQVFVTTGSWKGSTFEFRGSRLDPATGEVVALARWIDDGGPMTRLRDGRALIFDSVACRYTLVDTVTPGEAVTKTCDLENFDIKIVWQAPSGSVLLFGAYYPGGNDPEGAVYELDVAAATARKLETRTALDFGVPPRQPLQLCDGRVLFAQTEIHSDDFVTFGEAVHFFDPAREELEEHPLPIAPEDAAQLDATTALLLSSDDGLTFLAHLFDLETRELREVGAPELALVVPNTGSLVGLADGSALAIGDDGAIFRYLPAAERFEATALRFVDPPRALLRLPGGPVLALSYKGVVELYE